MGSLLYADATHIREQAKIDAARITQKSGNERRGAESSLQRFSAALSNQRAMDVAGSAVNDIAGNIARNLDAAAAGKFMSRIQAAEELGTSIAMASAAGVGGSTVEAYNATIRLNRNMQEEQNSRAVNADNILASANRGNQIKNAVASFDGNVYAADLDFNQYVDHQKASTLEQIVGAVAMVGASYFGGPQGGAAVMGVLEARQAARNGDFGTASQALTGAVQNGVGTAHNYQKTSGDVWGSVSKSVKDAQAPTGVPASVWQSAGVPEDKYYSSIRLR
jgi:hypothetical protein